MLLTLIGLLLIIVIDSLVNMSESIPDSLSAFQTVTSKNSPSYTSALIQCKQGWSYYSHTNHCYRVYPGKNWTDSEAVCVKEGGHLTSIHSAAEAFFISIITLEVVPFAVNETYESLDQQVWIGLRAIDNWKNWQWSDGSPPDYLNWALNEPNSPGVENCAQMALSGNVIFSFFHNLNDWNCARMQKAFVCKMQSLLDSTTSIALLSTADGLAASSDPAATTVEATTSPAEVYNVNSTAAVNSFESTSGSKNTQVTATPYNKALKISTISDCVFYWIVVINMMSFLLLFKFS